MYSYISLCIIFYSFYTDVKKYGLVISIFLPKNILYLFITIFYILPIFFGIEILSILTKGVSIEDIFNYISIVILSLIIFIHFLSKPILKLKDKGFKKGSYYKLFFKIYYCILFIYFIYTIT